MYKQNEINPKDLAPNCKHCGKPVKIIKMKGEPKAVFTVEIKPFYFTPSSSGSSDEIVVISNGQRRTGIPSRDGLRGFKEHQCQRNQAYNKTYKGGKWKHTYKNYHCSDN